MITEIEASEWWYKYQDKKNDYSGTDKDNFITIGREKDYIKQSAIKEVRKFYHDNRGMNFDRRITSFRELNYHWEKAYKELEERIK